MVTDCIQVNELQAKKRYVKSVSALYYYLLVENEIPLAKLIIAKLTTIKWFQCYVGNC